LKAQNVIDVLVDPLANPPAAKKSAIVIGAGPAGLVAAKHLHDEGFSVTILEKHSNLGGQWNPTTGVMWESMTTNLSYKICSFSSLDWPYIAIANAFPNQLQMFAYLQDFATNYNLKSMITFNTTVTKLSANADHSWQITYTNADNSTASMQTNYVVIASGFFAKPYIPADLANLKLITKKVAVVGNSFSGTEITAELAEHAQVTHFIRQPYWIIPRFIKTPFNSRSRLIDDVFYEPKPAHHEVIGKTQDAILKSNKYLATLSPAQNHHGHALYISTDKYKKQISLAISDNYLPKLQEHKISVKNINLTSEHYGNFSGFDAVVLCTGYSTNLDFLSASIKENIDYQPNNNFQPMLLHKLTFVQNMPNSAFIGVYKGPYLPIMELQANC
jgi:dimethylaniline monooxygenase (N-oxide forming)